MGETKKLFIVHETRKHNLSAIREQGLKKTSEILEKNQGVKNRKHSNNPALYLNYKPKDEIIFDEVDAVYCRVFKNFNNITVMNDDNLIVVLKPNCLIDLKWHFNTTENNGFYINKTSPFSGEPGKTIFSAQDILKEDYDESAAELVFLESIPKKYICKVLQITTTK